MNKFKELIRGFIRLPQSGDRELFRQIVESAPNAIVLVDPKGRIALVNAQTEKQFGYARSELIGKTIECLVPQRLRAAHPGHRTGFFADPSVRAMGAGRDLYGLHKDGHEFPVEIGLNPIRGRHGTMVLASIIDITERKRNEERFRHVVESAPSAIIMMGNDGRIALINTQTEKMFGYEREALLGQAIEVLVPARFRPAHPAHRDKFFASPSIRPMGAGRDLYGLRKNGDEFPVEIGLNPIQSDEGDMVLASIIDITERKRAEDGMRRLVQEIQEMANVLATSTSDIMSASSLVAAGSTETATAVSQTTSTMEEVKQTTLAATEKAQQVSRTAQKTAEISQGGRKSVQASIEAMQHIQGQMESVAESIIRLAEQGKAIGEIIATVNDLAEQSKLLAVNAAIEAANAGDLGKGFAVVAQEIKNLSEQSRQATAQVRTILGDIQKATGSAVTATEQGRQAVESGVKLSIQAGDAIATLTNSIEEAALAATQIAVSAQQQLAGMDQAVMAIRNISDASKQNVDSAKRSESVAHTLHELGSRLKHLLRQDSP